VTTYDYAQLEELWIGAGGPRPMAPLMAAIGLAESDGRSDAQNPSGAKGVWQIKGLPFPGDPFNAQVNAKMAVAKYRSQGLDAWETYTSGKYRGFLRQGVAPAKASTTAAPGKGQTTGAQGGGGGFWSVWNTVPGTGIPIGWISGAASSATDTATALGQLTNDISELMGWVSWLFVPSHWIRILCFVTGVPLVGLGIITMTKGTLYPPGAQQIAQTASQQGASIPVSAGAMAPALGIAEVTLGAILLFIAFHNLPGEVQTFPQLLAFVQSKASTGAASKAGPGAHVIVD
jgi:hypothetical protein